MKTKYSFIMYIDHTKQYRRQPVLGRRYIKMYVSQNNFPV